LDPENLADLSSYSKINHALISKITFGWTMSQAVEEKVGEGGEYTAIMRRNFDRCSTLQLTLSWRLRSGSFPQLIPLSTHTAPRQTFPG
jgi:hypothetical protein